jgi:hypothetical protein
MDLQNVRNLVAFLLIACSLIFVSAAPAAAQNENACWGQATAVFAQMGEMGEHASQQPTPRLGLKNLAEALYEQGVLDEPTLQALGAWTSSELGLSIDACME